MRQYDYLVVGAGFFGATFAKIMQENEKKCLVIDKNDFVGGLSFTQTIENIDVHRFGAHIFHTSSEEVWSFVNRFARFNSFINSPMAIYKDKVYNLPFNMNTFSKMWDVTTPEQAKKIIMEQTKNSTSTKPENLEEQAISMVGKDIYEILIKGYTEKQWGVDAKDLPAFIIKRLPVRFTYNNNYFNDKYQGIPIEGYTNLIQSMLEGIDLQLNANYFDQKEYYDQMAEKIVFTGPIDQYFGFCYGYLEYRSLDFITEVLDIENFQGNAVINYTERNIPYTRIIEHKFFNPKPNQTKTVITKEYPLAYEKDLPPYYPINNQRNNELYEKYYTLSRTIPTVLFGGRLGEYKYYNMDQAIEQAMQLARQELNP